MNAKEKGVRPDSWPVDLVLDQVLQLFLTAVIGEAVGQRKMANGDLTAFNVAAFICGLFVLEFGADKFIDHTAIVARRTGISQALIGLLTAGAEWEEVGRLCIDASCRAD